MFSSARTQRWIATLLSAVLLAGTLSPALQQVCAWSSLFAGSLPAHALAMHPSGANAENAHASSAHGPASMHAPPASHAPMESADSRSGHDSGHDSHDPHPCDGPCADGDCCSMQATPVDAPDVVLTERTPLAPNSVVRGSTSCHFLSPAVERGPPPRHQVDGSSLLLSARLHVWTATYRT